MSSSPPARDGVRPLPGHVRAFLEQPRFATIATISADGSPHQAVVWYGLDGDRLLINSRVGRRWPANLQRDPRLSMAVHEVERPYHWIGLAGRAELVHVGEEATRDIQALARRYGRDPARYAGQDRVTFAITVEHAFEYEG